MTVTIIEDKIRVEFTCLSCGCIFLSDEYRLELGTTPYIPKRLQYTYAVNKCPKCGEDCKENM